MRLDDGREGEVSQRGEISRKFHDSKKKHEFEGILGKRQKFERILKYY